MSNEPVDPQWSRLLSLAVHEFRTPITVVAGYIRMVLKERAGPISEQQRKLLEEAEKSCGRLSGLVGDMSDLSALEAGSAGLSRTPVDLATLLREVLAAMPELPDRTVTVVLEGVDAPVTISGDGNRLRAAITALITALRRELVTSDRLLVRLGGSKGASMTSLAIADSEQIDSVATAPPSSLENFDEWRGGSGLSLAIARRVIGQHGGMVLSPAGSKAAALILLPRAAG